LRCTSSIDGIVRIPDADRDDTGAAGITVVIPAYNAAAFLRRTLDSVAAQYSQPDAIVIADDGSSDDTIAVANAFAASHSGCAVRVLREAHRGPGAARNAAVKAAQTPWIAFLDSDDLWTTDKLSTVRNAMAAFPSVNFFCHDQTIRFLDGTTRVTDLAAAFDEFRPLTEQLWEANLFMTSAVVCQRELVLSSGGFDEGLKSAQDYELWLRISPRLSVRFLSKALGEYVERRGNISTTRFWRQLRNLWRVKHRHRDKVSALTYVRVLAYATLFHLAQPVGGALKRRLQHAVK
jgi:glycosyltransferase involved in cell wall biosynthesis